MELTDWELVQQCQAGEMSAFQELVSRYHQKVYMVIFGLLRNREDALEVAQETFFRAYRKISGFQGGSSFILGSIGSRSISPSMRNDVKKEIHWTFARSWTTSWNLKTKWRGIRLPMFMIGSCAKI